MQKYNRRPLQIYHDASLKSVLSINISKIYTTYVFLLLSFVLSKFWYELLMNDSYSVNSKYFDSVWMSKFHMQIIHIVYEDYEVLLGDKWISEKF